MFQSWKVEVSLGGIALFDEEKSSLLKSGLDNPVLSKCVMTQTTEAVKGYKRMSRVYRRRSSIPLLLFPGVIDQQSVM